MKNTQYTSLVALSDPEGSHNALLDADPFDFQPTADGEVGATWFAIDHTFHIEEPDADILAYYAQPRNAIVTLHTSDGAGHALGTALCPVRAHVYRLLQGCALHVEGRVERFMVGG